MWNCGSSGPTSGPTSLHHRARQIGEAGCGKFELVYSTLLLGVCWAIEYDWDNTLGVEKQSLRCKKARDGLVVLEPARRLGLSGSQAFRHPGTTGSYGRAENEWGPTGWIQPEARGEKGRLKLVLWGESPWLDRGNELELVLVVPMAGSTGRPSAGD